MTTPIIITPWIKNISQYSLLAIGLLLLTACNKPLPEERLDYAGAWQSDSMALLILADGSVAYERLKNGMTTSVNGPLKEFKGDDIVVGFGPFTTTFEVTQPPQQTAQGWTMTVDGIALQKRAAN